MMVKILFSLLAVFIFFGCDDGDENSYVSGDLKPKLASEYVVSIDENITTQQKPQIGVIPVESFGGSGIYKFELEVSGSSKITIDSNGIIYPVDGITFDCGEEYNIAVKAKNDYGYSNTLNLFLQVSCADQPFIEDKYINLTWGESLNDNFTFKRYGDANATIKDIIMYDEKFNPLGDRYGGIILDNDGGIYIDSCSMGARKYNLFVRALNSEDKISTYSKFIVNIEDVDNSCNDFDSDPVYENTESVYLNGTLDYDGDNYNFVLILNQEEIWSVTATFDGQELFFNGMRLESGERRYRKMDAGSNNLYFSGSKGKFIADLIKKYDDIGSDMNNFFEVISNTNKIYNALEYPGDMDMFFYNMNTNFNGFSVTVRCSDVCDVVMQDKNYNSFYDGQNQLVHSKTFSQDEEIFILIQSSSKNILTYEIDFN